jgi:hypothetical protein
MESFSGQEFYFTLAGIHRTVFTGGKTSLPVSKNKNKNAEIKTGFEIFKACFVYTPV